MVTLPGPWYPIPGRGHLGVTWGQTIGRAPSVSGVVDPCRAGVLPGRRHRPGDGHRIGHPAAGAGLADAVLVDRHPRPRGGLGPDHGARAAPTSTTARAGSSSSTGSTPSTSTRPSSSTPTRGSPGTSPRPTRRSWPGSGFNVVRLGMTWSGLEPGTAPANDPAICDHGKPANPHQFNQAVLDRYVARLPRRSICSVASTSTRSSTCTRTSTTRCSTVRVHPAGRCARTASRASTHPDAGPSSTRTKAAGIAFTTSGTTTSAATCRASTTRSGATSRALQREPLDPRLRPLQRAVLHVADPIRRRALRRPARMLLHRQAHIGTPSHGAPPLHCPTDDPASGVVPTILANDPVHLIFDEPDNYASRGLPDLSSGPMDLPNLVFNVHIYCGARSPVTGNPTNVALCAAQDAHSLDVRAADRPEMASARPTRGPGVARHRVRCDEQPAAAGERSRRRWTRSRSGGSTGPGSTTATPPAARPSRSSWPTGDCARRPACSAAPTRRRWPASPLSFAFSPDDRRLRPGLRAQPSHPRAHRHLRADRDPLPAGLLRPRHRGRGSRRRGAATCSRWRTPRPAAGSR